jgi:ABC-type lipoprotein release transport system permease subunit
VAGALALGRLIAAQLVDTSPRDPLALAVAVVILSVVLTVALWIPAQRAARLSPTEALRSA